MDCPSVLSRRKLRFAHAPFISLGFRACGGMHYQSRALTRQAMWNLDQGRAPFEIPAEPKVHLASEISYDLPNDHRGKTSKNHWKRYVWRTCLLLGLGAGDRTRTDDILLGKQTLYQLSYTRIAPIVAPPSTPIQPISQRSLSFLPLTVIRNHAYNPCVRGGVAQLGERYNRTVEVGGSSPPASTADT